MPKFEFVKKVLVIGSGPIVIGQAAEFDYAGSQAIVALREEGCEVVLINSNPATIMTDKEMADRVYIEPLTLPVLKRIIAMEKPDAIVPGLGGQTGLNLAMELHECGFLQEMGVALLGTPAQSIHKAEDRQAFKALLHEIGEPMIDSVIANDVDTALAFAHSVGYPLIVRPAYTLGGSGGGTAHDETSLMTICQEGLRLSRVHQVLVERSVAGYQEIEFEVMRDRAGTCLCICHMENIDAVGIHTGDSIVVAPCQTLSDASIDMLKQSAFAIITALAIEGGCNVQYALNPDTLAYYVIEVNPRVSRSSALASKATGYPIAKVTAKVAIGLRLDEIINGLTGATAEKEPEIDYTVIKFPRWPFDKFTQADKGLGTKMKATGEVMAIGETFESAWLKGITSLELGLDSLETPFCKRASDDEVFARLSVSDDERIFYVTEALRRGVTVDLVFKITFITRWFLDRILAMIKLEESFALHGLSPELLSRAKVWGFLDVAIARWVLKPEKQVRELRRELGIVPSFCKVDCSAGKAPALKPYYYSAYNKPGRQAVDGKKTVVVLGSGPIRIGQGIEFDYCSVHSAWALRDMDYETVIINCNPETVSTDYDTADRLYFEPLTPEHVLSILTAENPIGVVVQFGGQTAISLASAVHEAGYTILGTQQEDIDRAEDRRQFEQMLESLSIARPKGLTVLTTEQAVGAGEALGYPVLVRPSFVLGGQGMEIVYNEAEMRTSMGLLSQSLMENPVLIDQYIAGTEVEVDAICDGAACLLPGIMEHIERAGVHSGDSISIYPTQSITPAMQKRIAETTREIAMSLKVIGLMNIQYIVRGDDLYVIEVNPRSSRTVPYLSKVTGIAMIDIATRCLMGQSFADQGLSAGVAPIKPWVAIKVPVFSLEKLPDVETSLGPEMKSTGEVLGLAKDLPTALFKGVLASGLKVNPAGAVLLTVNNNDKVQLLPIAEKLAKLGYTLYATGGTAMFLNRNFVGAHTVGTWNEGGTALEELLHSPVLSLVINTPTKGRRSDRDGFRIRRMAIERGIPCLTSLDTAMALVSSLTSGLKEENVELYCLSDLN